jgi:hypothetical protein
VNEHGLLPQNFVVKQVFKHNDGRSDEGSVMKTVSERMK